MPRKGSYLVRGADGTMATVVAHSNRGAASLYIAKFRPGHGDQISVKLRGDPGDWTHYDVTRRSR